jgi:uncharacterized protein YndB with AHSA1/START domain
MNTDSIQKKVVLRAPLEKVWRALSDSKEYGAWFGMKFDAPFVPGAHLRGFLAPSVIDPQQHPYIGTPIDITIEEVKPMTKLSMRWHPFALDPKVDYSAEPTTLVVYTLEPMKEGVALTVTESGFDSIPLKRRAEAFEAHDEGWTEQVRRVGEYLAPSK